MKTYSQLSHCALILMVTCLFFSGYGVSQASSDLQSRRAAVKGSAFVQSAGGPASLIVQRIANLGNDVYVDLSSMARRLQRSDMAAAMKACCRLDGMF
jgi:hypothetical protein